MFYKKEYSKNLTSQEIRQKFLIAKYNKDVTCDHCGSDQVYIQNEDKNTWRCKNCWKFFSLTNCTFIENTKLSLRFWYEVICCFVVGHSANKAHGILETAYHQQVMLPYQVIRKALLHYSEVRWKEKENFFYEDGGKWNILQGLVDKLRKEIKDERRYDKAKKMYGFLIFEGVKLYFKLIDDLNVSSLESLMKIIENIPNSFREYFKLVAFGYFSSKGTNCERKYLPNKVYIKDINGSEELFISIEDLIKTKMSTHKGIKKDNLEYYLKEIEFRYNYGYLPFQEQVDEIIEILMKGFY